MTVNEMAYAKINLFLDVLSKMPNGFHEIVSVMHSVSLADEIELMAVHSDETKICLYSDSVFAIENERNLIYMAVRRYLERFSITALVDVRYKKNIPIGAGLGGGSSDAAATLRAMNKIFRAANDAELLLLASELGSDVPFCLVGGTALCRGRGERLTSIASIPAAYFAIAIGVGRTSTPEAYAKLDEIYSDFSSGMFHNTQGETVIGVAEALSRHELYNIFEEIYPTDSDPQMIKNVLYSLGAFAAQISGSGPSVFGMFESDSAARDAVSHLKSLGYEAFFATSV